VICCFHEYLQGDVSRPLDTFIKEKRQAKLRNPVLIGGFPGLGYVGKIAVTYLRKTLKATKLADLYSPYFPHHVVVSSSGRVRLPRAEFFFWKNPSERGRDLLFLTGDSQAHGFEGQYAVVTTVLEYAKRLGVNTVITLGGYRSNYGVNTPKVVAISSNRALLGTLRTAGAELSPAGNPIVGFAGLALGLARFTQMRAACLLGETAGYMPDPKTSKALLTVLSQFLCIDVDLASLDEEIKRSGDVSERLEAAEKEIAVLTKERADIEGRKMTYIS
jgi:uncharacterized protein (TIGR00162 family)